MKACGEDHAKANDELKAIVGNKGIELPSRTVDRLRSSRVRTTRRSHQDILPFVDIKDSPALTP